MLLVSEAIHENILFTRAVIVNDCSHPFHGHLNFIVTFFSCFCWSPKGKQLVVGSEAGTLTQYTPDLKAVKTISPPNLGSGNVAVVNVLWLSNYQFAAAYRDKVNADERPGVAIFLFAISFAVL